jgi:thiol-disulfide isomerase/thioredoxin
MAAMPLEKPAVVSAVPAVSPAPSSPETVLDVVCLCADWCGTCREYEATFEALQQSMPGHRYRWIDIEDEADAIGDIDVETFPTLMLAHAGRLLFAGPVLPRLGDAQRLLEVQCEVAAAGGALAAQTSGLPADQFDAFAALARQVAEG